MDNPYREIVEEKLVEVAGAIASTRNFSNEGTPTFIYVGEVDERVSSITKNAQTSTSCSMSLVIDEDKPLPNIKKDRDDDDNGSKEVVDFMEKSHRGQEEQGRQQQDSCAISNFESLESHDTEIIGLADMGEDNNGKYCHIEDLELTHIMNQDNGDKLDYLFLPEKEVDQALGVGESGRFETHKEGRNNDVEISKASIGEKPLAIVVEVGEKSDNILNHNDNLILKNCLGDDHNVADDFTNDVRKEESNSDSETEKEIVKVNDDAIKQEFSQEDYLSMSVEVKANDKEVTQLCPVANDKDYNDKCDQEDDLDLDALLGGNINTNYTENAAVYDDIDINHDRDDDADFGQKVEISIDVIGIKSSDFCISSIISQDKEAIELDALLDQNGTCDLSIDIGEQTGNRSNHNLITDEEEQVHDDGKDESSRGLDCSVATEDKISPESDNLVHESDRVDDYIKTNFEVIEEETPNLVASNMNNKRATRVSTDGRKGVCKVTNGGGRILFESTDQVRIERINKNTRRRNLVEARREMPARKAIGEKSNISSSISDTYSYSKKKITTTRDRMRDYSRVLSSRTSNQIRKDSTCTTQGNDKKDNTTNFGGEVHREGEEKKSKPFWGENANTKGFRHYMKSTITFTNKVLEMQTIKQHAKKLKESNTKKIQVNLTPWKKKRHPVVNIIHCDENHINNMITLPSSTEMSPKVVKSVFSAKKVSKADLSSGDENMEEKILYESHDPNHVAIRTPNKLFASPPPRVHSTHKDAQNYPTITFNKTHHEYLVRNAGAHHESPARSYAGQSIGSLSSYCTVESFVSPTKQGILGCQKKFDPFLYRNRGACELCIFRLPEIEKAKLNTQGRHLLVQFTTGGCRDCNAFLKSIGEPHVRLCRKCYSVTHRQMETRCRKKGNGTSIGYSFAKVSKGKIIEHSKCI